ncbi:helix-turn-helix domain-containing protein [Nakamurella sp. GG22]
MQRTSENDTGQWRALVESWDSLHRSIRRNAIRGTRAADQGTRFGGHHGRGHVDPGNRCARPARTPDLAVEREQVPAPAENSGASIGLTDREAQVLRLVASGYSNGQIGQALYISRRTASVHVSNILRKLGVSGRAEAAAIAANDNRQRATTSERLPSGNGTR